MTATTASAQQQSETASGSATARSSTDQSSTAQSAASAKPQGAGPGAQRALSVKGLSVSYTSRGVERCVVDDVSFSLARGETLAIVGQSGSGKSTIAQTIIGMIPANGHATAGSVELVNDNAPGTAATGTSVAHAETTDLTTLDDKVLRAVRGRRIGLIPQDPSNSLNPVRTIGASVAEAMQIHRVGDRRTRRARVLELLKKVGLDDSERRIDQYPHELSGGQRQRVLIAAAIALTPEVLIADEPTSALDVTVQRQILDLIDDLRREMNASVLLITHDLAVAGERADSLLVMSSGQVRETGPTAEVLASAEHEYTRQLLENVPRLDVVPSRRPVSVEEPDFLRVRDLSHHYNTPTGNFAAVSSVSFDVARGSTHAIVGESGSGKTTLGRDIAGFGTPSAGTISIGGGDVVKISKNRDFRRRVQLVYQNPYGSLNPKKTVAESISEPLRNFGLRSRSERDRRAARALENVALPTEFASRLPRELSGGQRQRVAIARALILRPELVVLDEAVSALDVIVQAQILRLLNELQQQLGLTYLFISHDLAVVRQVADTVSVLSRGEQVESGPTEGVLTQPQHSYTKVLLDAVPRISTQH